LAARPGPPAAPHPGAAADAVDQGAQGDERERDAGTSAISSATVRIFSEMLRLTSASMQMSASLFAFLTLLSNKLNPGKLPIEEAEDVQEAVASGEREDLGD